MIKRILISTSIISLLILGCGSSSDDDDTNDKKDIDSALKIGDVAFSTPSGIDFSNKMRSSLNKMSKVNSKKTSMGIQKSTESCGYSGSWSWETTTLSVITSYDQCIDLVDMDRGIYAYYDGLIGLSSDGNTVVAENYQFIPDVNHQTGTFMNLSMSAKENGVIAEILMDGKMQEFIDGYITEDITFKSLILKENNTNEAIYIDGDYSYKSKCLDSDYRFKTVEWLIPNSINNDLLDSGKIVINNKTYTYFGTKVTVKDRDGRTGEFEQSELDEEIEKKKNEGECESSIYQS